MTTIYLNPDQTMKDLATQYFGYNGKKYRVVISDKYHLQNYWDGGSKSEPLLIQREGLKVSSPKNTTTNPFRDDAHVTLDIPPGYFIMEHKISRGKDMGITFYVRSDEVDSMMLPKQEELSRDEMIVLVATRSFKSSYGGVKDYRYQEARRVTGITVDRWNVAKEILIEKKLLNKNSSISNEGRNAVGMTDIYTLKES